MAGYVKMFQSILDSTIWKQPAAITKVWLTMMAMSDRDGVVTAAVPGLADRAHVSIATAEKALGLFLAPDPYSKTPDNEGRRIEVVRGGWRLLNYEMHREMMSSDDQRTKNADRQQRWRDRQRNGVVTLRNTECDNTESDSLSSASSGPSGSPQGQTHAKSNSDAELWGAVAWLKAFGSAWLVKYNQLSYGCAGDSKACGALGELLERLPVAERMAAQAKAPEMFAEFFSRTDRVSVERRHPFAFFVQEWGALRVPRLAAASAPRDLKVGHHAAEVKPRPEGVVDL